MEFDFELNDIFGPDDIGCLNDAAQPYDKSLLNYSENRRRLMKVIDTIGSLSAKSQGLRVPVTDGSRFLSSGHHLYFIKDSSANRGRGSITGFLKTGYKRLFLYDNQGNQHEVEPLCVLDFYVHESKQRKGHGKTLFEFMLQRENQLAHHVAVDRPSQKLLSFFEKHYKLKPSSPQIFNFVIFRGFFVNRPKTMKNPNSNSNRNIQSRPSHVVSSQMENHLHNLKFKPLIDNSSLNSSLHHPEIRNRLSPNGINTYSRYSYHNTTPRSNRVDINTIGDVKHNDDNTPVLSSQADRQSDSKLYASNITEPPVSTPRPEAAVVQYEGNISKEEFVPIGKQHIDSTRQTEMAKTNTLITMSQSRTSSTSKTTGVAVTPSLGQGDQMSLVAKYIPHSQDTSWHIFGVPHSHRLKFNSSNVS